MADHGIRDPKWTMDSESWIEREGADPLALHRDHPNQAANPYLELLKLSIHLLLGDEG